VLHAASSLAWYIGREPEAIAYAQAAVARDPQNPTELALLGSTLLAANQLDESIASMREALRLSPDFATAHAALAFAQLGKGDPQSALIEAQKESGPWRTISLALVYHALGRKAESDAALADLTRDWPRDAPYNIASIHAYRGERDLAFEWLDKAVQFKDPGIADVATNPFLASLHGDPRWLPFLRKIGFAPEQLTAIQLDVPVPAVVAVAATPD
jgi:tetratricopeptide (TPR) repeat protein